MQNNPHIQEQLEAWVENNKGHAILGTTAQYIPALGKVDPSKLGICMVDDDGNYYCRRYRSGIHLAEHFQSIDIYRSLLPLWLGVRAGAGGC